jgi:uncharacterized membrane protein YfcA
MARPNSSYLKTLVVNALRSAISVLTRLTGIRGIVSTLSLISEQAGPRSAPLPLFLALIKTTVLVLTGIACGAWAGLTGMSAALPCTQALSWLIGLRGPRLNAVSIVVALAASLAGLVVIGQHKLVDLPVALIFAVASPIGALIGATPIFADIRDRRTPRIFWCVSLVFLGIIMVSASHIFAPYAGNMVPIQRPLNWAALDIEAGFAAGFYGRLSGTGPAAVIPALIIIGHLSVFKSIVAALSIYAIVSVAPAIAYITKDIARSAPVTWPVVGAVVGALTGAHFALIMHPRTLIICYGVSILVLAGVLLIQQSAPIKSEKTES